MAKRKAEESEGTDKDIEVAKILICSERAHSRYTTMVSSSFAIFIGFIVVFWTLLSENLLPYTAFGAGVVVLSGGTIYEIYRIRRSFRQELKRISDMIETVKEGKELPKLEELVE